jgi:hypothetical protein
MRPTLWVEGSASYFGSAIANLRIPFVIDEVTPSKPHWISGTIPTLDSLSIYKLNIICPCSDEVAAERQKIMNLQYWAGALMTELMVAQFGLDKTIALMNRYSEIYVDKTATWQSIFKDNFGVTWQSWSKNADLYVEDMLLGNSTELQKYNKNFEISDILPFTPQIDRITAGVKSLTILAHGSKTGMDEVKYLTVIASTGQKCTITGIMGSCTITGLTPENKTGIKVIATNASGDSPASIENYGTALAPSPKVVTATVSFESYCSTHFIWDILNMYCFKLQIEWDNPALVDKSNLTIDLGFGSNYLSSSGSYQFVLQRNMPNVVLGTVNKFQITSQYGDAPVEKYDGTYNLLLTDILPTLNAPVAKLTSTDQVQINWDLNPALKGKGFLFEIGEVNSVPNKGSTLTVVKRGIQDTETQVFLPKPTYKEGTTTYVLRIQSSQNQALGVNSFQSNSI